MNKGMGSHERGTEGLTNVWLTPPYILDALGPFDLDPCASVDRPWNIATTHYTEVDDGLSRAWNGFVWCNPPYGRDTYRWLDRMAKHNNGIALVFARTETEGFFNGGWHGSDSMLFLRKRLQFHLPNGELCKTNNAGAPSVLLAYGTKAIRRLNRSGLPGAFVFSWKVLT